MPFPFDISLRHLHILVVEDSYLVAQELTEALERKGADVVGPVSSLYDAHRLMLETPKLDAAVLDVSIRGEMVWLLADALTLRQVPLVFATGYAAAPIKARYKHCQVAQKPAPAGLVARLVLSELMATS